jgi:hypothetical protein
MELTFNPYPGFWTIIVPGLVICSGFLIWKESFRKGRKLLRFISIVLAVICLLAIAVRPSIRKSGSPRPLALLTMNYSQKDLDSLLIIRNNLVKIDLTAKRNQLEKILMENSVSEVFVMGDGLEIHELNLLSKIPSNFLPSDSIKGIVGLNYNTRIERGEMLQLEIETKTDQDGFLVLEHSSGRIDSFATTRGVQKLNIKTPEKVSGNFILEIKLFDNKKNLLDKGVVPYRVSDPEPIHVFFLQGYPTFETRFLKDWLQQKKHKVVVRSKVSRNDYVLESFNIEKPVTNVINLNWIEKLDLIITDFEGWIDLSASEKDLIAKEIRDNGLGVLFLLDEASRISKSELKMFISRNHFQQHNKMTAELILRESGVKFITPRIELKPGTNPFTFTINQDSKNEAISFGSFYGLGKVGFSLLPRTYTLALNGFMETYSDYWAEILDKLGKSWNKEYVVINSSSISRVGLPLNLTISSTLENPQLKIDSIPIGLRQDLYFSDLWTCTFWPNKTGWLPVQINNEIIDWIFIFPDEYWVNLELERKKNTNKRNLTFNVEGERKIVLENYPVSPLYFYLIFTICIGLLWLEPRLN